MSATVGIGVVGTGWITRAHAHALHSLNHIDPLERRARLVSLAGRNEERTAAAAAELGFERSTTRWEETLEDPEVDVVACLAAVPAHAEVSLAALAAGRPVLCEKPLAGDPAATAEMVDAARASGVTHACGYNYRYVPAVRLMHDVLARGRSATCATTARSTCRTSWSATGAGGPRTAAAAPCSTTPTSSTCCTTSWARPCR